MLPIWMDSWSNGPGTNGRFFEAWRIAPAIRPLKQEVVGSVGNVLWVVMGTIGLVMLIACANVTNLLLVKAESRQQELAVRASLGAGWVRIVRVLLLESMLLGLMGGALGIGIAVGGLRLLAAIGPANLPRLGEISMDGRTLCFTLLLSLLSGLFSRADPGSEIRRSEDLRGPPECRADAKREPGTPSRPQSSGRRPSCAGPGTDGERRLDDSHVPGIAGR